MEAVRDISGTEQLSDQKIQQIVSYHAKQTNRQETENAREVLQSRIMPEVNIQFDIYDPKVKETLIELDGISCKEQKEYRDNIPKENKSFVSNMIALVENQQGKMEAIVGLEKTQKTDHTNLKELIQSKIIINHGGSVDSINPLAITDGAKDIRKLLFSVFGVIILVILDWFHLKKRVNENMSMFGLVRSDKENYIKEVLRLLWIGKTSEAILILQNIVVKKAEKRDELVEYLNKHKEEIIDYKRRQELGKSIGSGRIENTVNQIVGIRQKSKGMSWSQKGSSALAILKTLDFNEQWDNYWQLKLAA